MAHSTSPRGSGPLVPPSLFASLRVADFRFLLLGTFAGHIAFWMQIVAQGWLAYELTGSATFLGLVSFASALPSALLTLPSGVLADRWDRRHLVLASNIELTVTSMALLALVVLGTMEPWHLVVLGALTGAGGALNLPARQALGPALVAPGMLSNAVALGSLSFNLSRVLGPAAAGVLIAGFGLAGCFLVQTVLMLVASLLTGLIRSGGDRSFASRRQSSLRNFTAGIQQVRLDPVLRGCVIVAVLQNLFGLTYSHLMPVFAEDVLSVGASGLGVLMTAVGLGSTAGAVAATALSTHRRKGFVLFAAAVGYGLAIVAFSSTTWMPLALTALIALGASQAITQIATQTVLNLVVGNEYRGRVNSLFIATWSIGPAVALAAGWSADHVGAPLTVGACGLLTVISMLGAAAWLTELRRFAEQEPVFAMADTVPSPTDSG